MNLIGIGTSVVTCPRQPSLGCVYKVEMVSGPVGVGREPLVAERSGDPYPSLQLVSVGGQPRMKLTEDPEKQTLPGSKAAFRLWDADGEAPHPLAPWVPQAHHINLGTTRHTQGLCCSMCFSWQRSPHPRLARS